MSSLSVRGVSHFDKLSAHMCPELVEGHTEDGQRYPCCRR